MDGTRNCQRNTPEQGSIKINYDASVLHNVAGFAGIFSDANRDIMGMIYSYANADSVLEGELCAMRLALREAKKKGYERVVVQILDVEIVVTT